MNNDRICVVTDELFCVHVQKSQEKEALLVFFSHTAEAKIRAIMYVSLSLRFIQALYGETCINFIIKTS